MSITLPITRDDTGTRRLQEANAIRAAAAVAPVGAVPAVDERAAEPVPAVTRRTPPPQERRRGDRRRGDRRQARHSVLLDTRHQQDRRRQPRRAEDAEDRAVATGIDVYV